MPKGYSIDLDLLHGSLWERVDRHRRVRIKQAALAEEMGITKFTMSRVIAKLIEQKRLRRVSNMRQNSGVFVVEDPDEWREAFGGRW